jgi:hypothetical protein
MATVGTLIGVIQVTTHIADTTTTDTDIREGNLRMVVVDTLGV